VAVGAGIQLRHRSEAGGDRLPVSEWLKAALADRLITVHLRLIGLVDRARAYILGSQVEGIADLVLHRKAPLHEVRRMELAIRHGSDRNRRTAGISARQGRGAEFGPSG
jgi:hypothetical protein